MNITKAKVLPWARVFQPLILIESSLLKSDPVYSRGGWGDGEYYGDGGGGGNGDGANHGMRPEGNISEHGCSPRGRSNGNGTSSRGH